MGYFFLMNIICKTVLILLMVKNSNSSHFCCRTRHLNSPEKTLCKENERDMEKTRVTANCRLDVGEGLTDRQVYYYTVCTAKLYAIFCCTRQQHTYLYMIGVQLVSRQKVEWTEVQTPIKDPVSTSAGPATHKHTTVSTVYHMCKSTG